MNYEPYPKAMSSEYDCWIKFQSMIYALRESSRAKENGDYDLRGKLNSPPIDKSSDYEEVSSATKCPDEHIAYYMYKFQQQFQCDIIRKFSNFFSSNYHKRVFEAIDNAAGV